ncbi:MAG: AMP-binding protein, partial [Methylococcales bacterium]|nr:AMP-binding protein [Methylococcales bacterium]
MQAYGIIPAMLNYSMGGHGMILACQTAKVKQVITSRLFIKKAKLDEDVKQLAEQVELIYLEDIGKAITLTHKIQGWFLSKLASLFFCCYLQKISPDDAAVVLFTSGSEGVPKGVVLSHRNLLANRAQLASRIDFSAQDIILNALPMFHSFGLTAGTLLPLLSGVKTFLYPSPMHYRIIPEVAYEINATILFGTNTFLNGYAKYAHPYDFYSIRYVFAGAEKLQNDTRQTWAEKFGIRIFEGYGATETSPVLSSNTPMEHQSGSVGLFLPGIEYRLINVPGIEQGGQLHVKGPNIMKGYFLNKEPGVLVPPHSEAGQGWYDTGDIVDIDEEGYIRILGRVKRFAKIAGEMVSLTSIEEMVSHVWPDYCHAVTAIPDEQKGEQIILMTEKENANRKELIAYVKEKNMSELMIPRQIDEVSAIPILGSGKIDYVKVNKLVNN